MSVAILVPLQQSKSAGDLGRWAPLLSAILAFAVYACTLGGTYIYDDLLVTRDDPRISNPSLWWQFWTREYMVGAADRLYRPLVSMSFAVQHWLHGDKPWALHLVNILLHAGVAALVAELGRRIAGSWVAWIAGVLFAVHPIHVEAVAGLVGRAELACTASIIGGLCLFLCGRLNAGRIIGIGACLLTAMLSKEQGLLFPLILLSAIPLRYPRGIGPAERQPLKWLAVTVCWVMAGYVLWREWTVRFYWDRHFLDWEFNPLVRSTGADRWLMPLVLIGRYLALLVAPIRLSIDYGAHVIGWHTTWRDPYLFLGVAAVIGWLALLSVSLVRRQWALLFCLLGLAITYGMIGNIVALIGTNFAERLMYLPSAFFLLAVALLLAKLPGRLVAPLVAVLVMLGAGRAVTYAHRWSDPLSFYQNSVREQPRSVRVYALLYSQCERLGDWQSAMEVGRRCSTELPDCWEAYAMQIEAAMKLGDLKDADAAADEGLRHCPTLELKLWKAKVQDEINKSR